ncbi:hypothetical protein FJZ36_18225 [Candidatus Poribacteria bacterium]|nr:hypothetical protein [Candidatus Poribacteria bacterium]
MPKSMPGKLSLAFFAGIWIAFGVQVAFSLAGETGGNGLFDSPKLAIPAIIALLEAAGALVSGIIAIVRFRERAALTYIVTGAGAAILLIALAEVAVPH